MERNNSTYLDTYAWILYKQGLYEEARKYMRQALSYDKSKSPTLPEHYGDILFALGDYFMARTYWGKALELGADKASIEERIARAEAAEKQQKAANNQSSVATQEPSKEPAKEPSKKSKSSKTK